MVKRYIILEMKKHGRYIIRPTKKNYYLENYLQIYCNKGVIHNIFIILQNL